MDTSTAAQRLEDLRRRRSAPARDAALTASFSAAARELARTRKRLAGAAGAWDEACPPALLGRTAIGGVARGVLTIHVSDAPARFELDRWLRSGGEMQVIRASPTTVRKVRLVIGRAPALGGA